jgi:hypothetical protein
MHEIFNSTIGLNDFGTLNMQVYPNPSAGVFNVNGVADGTEVSVYSLAGQYLSTTVIHVGTFDGSNLPTGTYLLIFADEFISIPVKINIQK